MHRLGIMRRGAEIAADRGDAVAFDQQVAASRRARFPGRAAGRRGTAAGSRSGRPVAEIRGQDLEAGHAHRDPHLDLLADEAAVDVVGDLAADLDAAVHRPGMHDQRIGLGGAQFVVVEPEEVEILAGRRHECAVHPLALQAQHHHDVDAGEPLGHVVKHLDAEPLDPGRQQGARRHDPDARSHVLSSAMFERATRLCRTSPQIATVSPPSRPLRRRIVSASSSAWVGCSWLPSPALMTAQSSFSESSWTAPDSGWRTTSTSGCIAFKVIAVSIRVSPLCIELAATDMLMTSPPSRLPATSKEVRVRVEFSKKQLMIVRPRKSDALLLGLPVELDIAVGEIEDELMSSGDRPSMPSRWRCGNSGVAVSSLHEPGTIGAAFPAGKRS